MVQFISTLGFWIDIKETLVTFAVGSAEKLPINRYD
jgi:hypothetical protein